MDRLHLNIAVCPEELRPGLAEIQREYAHRFDPSERAPVLEFVPEPSRVAGLAVTKDARKVTIRYGRKTDAFRALGRVLGECHSGLRPGEYAETPQLDCLGVMADVSRNGVLLPEAARAFMCRLALMGYNSLILYAEDTYEVPGEPFFGYLRGRYTRDEMKAMDDYADALGIEMFPCIQTLAHLAQILQWPAYHTQRDTADILLAEDEATYRLVEKMIAAASAPFRSKRIHIGMDEAHGIGTGEFRRRFGEKNPFDILNDHLARVQTICRNLGLKPMIWSDMYFRLGSKTHDYYDRKTVIPPEVVARIPKGVDLVYWDYYHLEQDFYEEWIDRHRALGSEPVMAGGVWTWNHLWAALPFSLAATKACLDACKRKQLRQVFMTLWGDDGMECDVFSALPGLQFCAEHAYAETVIDTLVKENFRGSCDANYDTWLKAAELDTMPGVKDQGPSTANVSKWLLWQDPLLGLLDPQVADPSALAAHYAALSETLFRAADTTSGDRRLIFPASLARVLASKCVLRGQIADAYRAGDRKRLRSMLAHELPFLRQAVDDLWVQHRQLWLSLYKPFGLEVIECRYGGLRTRLESFANRLQGYVDGTVKSIPELETKLEKIYAGDFRWLHLSYHQVKTPSVIK
ncbi:MAG: beta-N-acetylhexosaminidase [Verrucomicrobia bacterium]|nr:beta-N-acetylhexosaminidase [Verrucomicrobiota bacterium]MBU4292161.1 beta-N-acetylhexosaminidase [Verrucomicrobiota bacterium]MBU4429435.1 beta-N-acetylhexosaminidase [Verrucomicrobiota bacterium]MCG2681606.1 beta-N-acetylhexosaminidase [Kiritimatiellia bacterium]